MKALPKNQQILILEGEIAALKKIQLGIAQEIQEKIREIDRARDWQRVSHNQTELQKFGDLLQMVADGRTIHSLAREYKVGPGTIAWRVNEILKTEAPNIYRIRPRRISIAKWICRYSDNLGLSHRA